MPGFNGAAINRGTVIDYRGWAGDYGLQWGRDQLIAGLN
jgi:hypothetical protein